MTFFSFFEWRQYMKTFFGDERGSLGVGMALSLVPVLILSLGSILLTDVLARDTRFHAASCAAVLAVAKEGDAISEEGRQNLLRTWTQQNLQALNRKEETFDFAASAGTNEENVIFSTTPHLGIMPKSPRALHHFSLEENVTAERYYAPLEVAVVFSASASSSNMQKVTAARKQAVRRTLEYLFSLSEKPGDVKVSLIQYSNHVNIGLKYGNRLIKPSSRKLWPPNRVVYDEWGDPQKKTQEHYDKQCATLAYHGLSRLKNNLLAGGPIKNYNMVAPVRRTLDKSASTAQKKAYCLGLEEAPATPEEGFHLMILDGRFVLEDTLPIDLNWGSWRGGFFTNLKYLKPGQIFYRDDIRKIALLPEKDGLGNDVVVPSQCHSGYLSWGKPSRWAEPWTTFIDGVIALPAGIPEMPILIGAESLDEALTHLDKYKRSITASSAPDEGLAWALRALSPKWSSIWDKGDTFPSPWKGGADKRIVFFGDSGIPGGAGYSRRWSVNVMPELTKMFKELGIKTTLAIDYSLVDGYFSKDTMKALAEKESTCQGPLGSLDISSVFKRSYGVRLKADPVL